MIESFSIPVQITGNRTVYFYELKNKHFFSLLKIIQNQDFKTLNSFFESLLSELAVDKDMLLSLNFIDKIIALITIRSVCISPDIDFENNKAIKVSKKIALSTVYKQLEQIQFTHECKIDDTFKIIFNIPNSLYYASIDELIESCIDEIYLNNEKLLYSKEDKKQILESLPGAVFVKAKEFLDKLETVLGRYVLLKEDNNFDFKQIELSLVKNTGFGFLASLYRDNLLNFYNLIFIFTYKLNMNLSEYFNLTPAESSLLLSFYVKEQEEIKKTSENKNVPIGKKVDN